MDRTRFNIIFLLVPFLLFACSSTKHVQKKPPSGFDGITLSKGIEKKSTRGVPLEPTNIFSTQDSEVIAHLKFDNLAGKHRLRWDWYGPDGKLYYSTGNFPVKTSKGKYLTEATVWHGLSVRGDKASYLPGEWEVKVFLDNSFLESKQFQLNAMAGIDDLPDTGQRPYPKDWALVIGIEDYSSLPSVEYARRDALVVKEYFNKMMGVPEENIITLVDGDATKARIEGYLKQYLPTNISSDTTLYVYYADRLKSFYNDLDNLKTGKVYVFLDSCFSGVASRAAEMLTKGARPALIHVEDVSIDSANIVSLSASTGSQISNSYPEAQHGLFTYYLLRGLRGEADSDDDNWVSVKEAYSYVKSHVVRVSRRMGTEQTPVIMPPVSKLKDLAISRTLR
jgi:hypothetical protein